MYVVLFHIYRKPVQEGVVYCSWCKDKILYKATGKKSIVAHMNTAKHLTELKERRTNSNLPGTSKCTSVFIKNIPSRDLEACDTVFKILIL